MGLVVLQDDFSANAGKRGFEFYAEQNLFFTFYIINVDCRKVF